MTELSPMRAFALMMLAALVCPAASALAGGLSGYVDGLTTANAGGWACATNTIADVSVAAYAGPWLVGIYPETVNRPDVAPYCHGAQANGFSIAFDAGAQALFAGQTQLSLFEIAPGQLTRLLPPSTAATRNPLPLPPPAPPSSGWVVPITATLAQQGAIAGIRGTLLTTWLPPMAAIAGLSGSISLRGNDPTFSEALVQLGTTTDGQASCARQNQTAIAGAPALSHLWAGILKSNSAAVVGVPVNVMLAEPVAGGQGGTCLVTWISAGYPFLSASKPRYTSVSVALQVYLARGGAAVLPFGMGGEFRLSGALPPRSGAYVGIRAMRPIAVDGIAATQSAAPVIGAPAGSGWQTPLGGWVASTSFIVLPAQLCQSAHLQAQPGNGTFAVLRQATQAALTLPASATALLRLPMPSRGAQAIQRAVYAPVGDARPGGFAGRLEIGDCLIAVTTASIEPAGVLDVENQSTVFLRPL